jgi:hypothetical protein
MLDRQRLPLTVATRATADSPFLAVFERLREAPNHAELWRCRRCGSYWFLVLDWDADDWYLERTSRDIADAIVARGEWPSSFLEFGATWPSGQLRWSSSAVAATFRGGRALEMLLQDEDSLIRH